MTLESHRTTLRTALDCEMDIDLSVQHIHLTPDPRHLALEIYLFPQIFACFGRSTEGIHGGGNHAAGGLLVVENAEGGGDEDYEEDRDGADPFHAIFWYI